MGGPAQSTVNAENAVSRQQVSQGQQSQQQSGQLFNTTYPWLTTAGNYYTQLASGNPQAIQAASAPAAEQIAANTAATEQNINTTMPRGGAKDLAIQQAELSKSAQIGGIENKAYTSAFPALASLSGQGLGLSVNEMANAIAGLGQASSTLGTVGNQQAAGKASTLGFIGALAGAGSEAAAAA